MDHSEMENWNFLNVSYHKQRVKDTVPCDSLSSVLVLITVSIAVFWYFRQISWFFKRRPILELCNNEDPNVSTFLNWFSFIRSLYRQSTAEVPLMCLFFQALQGFCHLFDSQKIVQFYIGVDPWVLFFKPETVKAVLSRTKDIRKPKIYHLTEPWIGNGLILSTGKIWHQRRKLLTPAFHFTVLKDFVSIFHEHSSTLVSKLHDLSKEPFVDAAPLISKTIMDIICETSMGVRLDSDEDGDVYCENVEKILDLVIKRAIRPWLYPDTIFRVTPSGREVSRRLRQVHDFVRKVIKEKKEMMKSSKNSQSKPEVTADDNSSKKKPSFLEILLEVHLSDPTFTEEDIMDEVNVFMVAGHDSGTCSVNWILYHLGLYEDIQRKAHDEIDSIFQGDSDRKVTHDDVMKMKYIECIIKETFRVQPTFPLFAREAEENFQVLDYTVRKGTTCLIFPSVLHMDKENFPNPEKFIPERFLPENRDGIHPYAFIPFAAGPRNCIGQKFAMMELKTITANILRRFYIKALDHRDKVNVTFALSSKNVKPLRLHFIPRENM